MAERWTFGRKLAAGFAVAVVVQLVTAAFGYRSTDSLIDDDRWVDHTHAVRRDLADLLSAMKDAETGQRGFVLTGDAEFLEPYEGARGVVRRRFDSLRRLTSDNAAQQRRLDALRPAIAAKLEELASTIALRRTRGLNDVLPVVASGRGRVLMDRVRSVVAQMDDEERELLGRRAASAEASATSTKAVILWGSVAGVLFVIAAAWFISRSLTQQIAGAVRHIQSSSSELHAAASQQATGAREQATAMNEIRTTITELLATSRQIAESAQRVAQIADQTASASRDGDTTVERGRESVAAMRRQVDVIVQQMLELGAKSQQIGAVLEIVSELAEQTNILAINATIEAAGAGDAGQRFGVVADEIRKLADRVAGSTKDIRRLIDDVRSAVNTTVMTTETGSKAVDVGSRQFSEVAVAFQRITSQVTTTTEAAREIELSTKQQATAVAQVNAAITSVAQATFESEASTSQTVQTASELAGLSRDLMRIVAPQVASASMA